MQGRMRKQYLSLEGKPVLARTLTVFDRCEQVDRIIAVVPQEDLEFCRREIIPAANLKKEIDFVIGGARRQDSVYNGLKTIETDEGIVLIHDGVRPFVRQQHLIDCIKSAHAHGACILGLPAFDTVKMVTAGNEIVKTPQRSELWLAQTPQAFKIKLIKTAHAAAAKDGFSGTDDAGLVERLGVVVKIIKGGRSNIKITDQEDLMLARAILQLDGSNLQPD